MTNEMIENLYKISDILENEFGGNPYSAEEQEILDSIDSVIQFIEWYDSIDVIERGPLLAFLSNMSCDDWLLKAISDIDRFPKVEYVKEN